MNCSPQNEIPDLNQFFLFKKKKLLSSRGMCGCCSVFLFRSPVRFRTHGRCIALMLAECDARDILLAPRACNDHEFCTFELIKLLLLKLVTKTLQ